MTRPYSPAWKAAMAVCCVAAVVAIVCQPANADEWTGKDKAGHAQAGALIGGIAAAAFGCLAAKFTSLIVGPNRIVFRKEF